MANGEIPGVNLVKRLENWMKEDKSFGKISMPNDLSFDLYKPAPRKNWFRKNKFEVPAWLGAIYHINEKYEIINWLLSRREDQNDQEDKKLIDSILKELIKTDNNNN